MWEMNLDQSTDGVTLYAGFILDLVSLYEKNRASFAAPLFEMTKDIDSNAPTALVSIERYNDVCTWIEKTLGPSNLRLAGTAIGERVYDQMTADDGMGSSPSPVEILQQLKRIANFMIQDPKDRQWELSDIEANSVRIQRRQTFNCILQEGLLISLVQRTGVTLPQVNHERCTRRGDEFCEYVIKWMLTE